MSARVLVAVGNYPPGHGGGGLRAHRTYRRVMELMPVDVTAVTVSGRGEPQGVGRFEGVTVIRTRPISSFYAQFIDIGRQILKHGLRPFDIIHSMGMSHVAAAACAWALLLGIPVIRELTMDSELPGGRGPFGRMLRLGFTRAQLLIALNDPIRRHYLAAGIPPSLIWARPNPVDTEVFRPPNAPERIAARERFGLREADHVHLVLARFQDRKNQAFAVEAMAHLGADHKLLLAGPAFDTDYPYLSSVRQLAAECGVEERTIIVPEEIWPALTAYHAADVYWLPSRQEGLPNVMLEALCCGIPVVANSELNVQAHVIDGVNGFNVPLEPGAFANAANIAASNLGDPGALSSRVTAAHELYDARSLSLAFAKRLRAILGTDDGAIAK